MVSPRRRDLLALAAGVPALLWRASRGTAADSAAPVILDVDARDVSRRILRARLSFPASPGPFTLVYPKWIPGEHAPSGPINDIVEINLRVGGKTIPWQRDAEDMYEIRCDLPPGTKSLEVGLDHVTASGGRGAPSPSMASERLAVIKWNQVLLYPKGADPRELMVAPSVRLPPDWSFATALEVGRKSSDVIRFRAVSLETLVDSPLCAGAHARTLDLSPAGGPPHALHLFADSPEALAIKDQALAAYRRLVIEANRLFGAWPYRRYRFLFALSDVLPPGGLEHHESSDNRSWERTLLDDAQWTVRAGLLPHELVHAWNGKHRRPAGLVTHDFQQPMKTDLLWVYEGLTTYLGEMLTARAGLRAVPDVRDALAYSAATLDATPGRSWRTLADTAVSTPVLSTAVREWRSLRRGLDFYPEALLMWLEADVLIRRKTAGGRSLDDLCRSFFGRSAQGRPSVVPYTLDDVTATLTEICPHGWREFFQARVTAPTPHPPLAGIELGGWRLCYRDEPTPYFRSVGEANKELDYAFSLGLVLKEDGTVLDVIEGRPAARAGIAPASKVVAANGRKLTRDVLREAVAATKHHTGIELLTENDGFYRTHRLAWNGGNRFPTLERNEQLADLLTLIWTQRPA